MLIWHFVVCILSLIWNCPYLNFKNLEIAFTFLDLFFSYMLFDFFLTIQTLLNDTFFFLKYVNPELTILKDLLIGKP